MKLKIFNLSVIIACIAIFIFSIPRCDARNPSKIKGNKNILIKDIPISDYDKIVISNVFDVEYSQSPNAPRLQVETDENIFIFIDIQVKEKTLYIDVRKNEPNANNTIRLLPTKLIVRTNSMELISISKLGSSSFTFMNEFTSKKLVINQMGSGSFTFLQKLQIDQFRLIATGSGTFNMMREVQCQNIQINKVGSGTILFNQIVKTKEIDLTLSGPGNIQMREGMVSEKLNVNQSGSGNITIDKSADIKNLILNKIGSGNFNAENVIECKVLSVSQIGSGNVNLTGKFNDGQFNISGSGNVQAEKSIFDTFFCSIVGSSSVTVTVINELKCNITGSGKLTYKGNPSVISEQILGSGKIIQIPK